jgi:hypothetical protein
MGQTILQDSASIQGVAVDAPSQFLVGAKGGRRGDLLEADARAAERRIGAPEAIRSVKIRQARIDAHTGTGGYHQRIGHIVQARRNGIGCGKRTQAANCSRARWA